MIIKGHVGLEKQVLSSRNSATPVPGPCPALQLHSIEVYGVEPQHQTQPGDRRGAASEKKKSHVFLILENPFNISHNDEVCFTWASL